MTSFEIWSGVQYPGSNCLSASATLGAHTTGGQRHFFQDNFPLFVVVRHQKRQQDFSLLSIIVTFPNGLLGQFWLIWILCQSCSIGCGGAGEGVDGAQWSEGLVEGGSGVVGGGGDGRMISYAGLLFTHTVMSNSITETFNLLNIYLPVSI